MRHFLKVVRDRAGQTEAGHFFTIKHPHQCCGIKTNPDHFQSTVDNIETFVHSGEAGKEYLPCSVGFYHDMIQFKILLLYDMIQFISLRSIFDQLCLESGVGLPLIHK